MRTNSRGAKLRPCNLIPLSNSSRISLPGLYKDEDNEEYHVNGIDYGASKDTSSSRDNDNNDADDEGNGDDNDDDEVGGGGGGGVDGDGDYGNVVPDSLEELDRCAGENLGAGPSRKSIVLDWSEIEYCISCKSRSGQVLVCSENECPIAMHEACMNCTPKYDNMGKFYCPYCWYKRELLRTKELRKKAMLAWKKLSNFRCLKRDGGIEEKQVDETSSIRAASESTMAGKIDTGDCKTGLNDDDNERIHHNQVETLGVESISKEKSEEERNPRAHGFENIEDGERMLDEDIENVSDSEDDKIGQDQWQIVPYSSSALFVATKETSDNLGVLEENQRKRGKEETMLLNAVGTAMVQKTDDATSKFPAIESFEFGSHNLDTETLVHRKRVKRRAQKRKPQKVDSPRMSSSERSTSMKDNKMNWQGKASAAKNSVQCQELTKQIISSKLGAERRRRLCWTAEEEDMLKEGVRRFSCIANKNIPWRKILEFGHHVFHATRTPVDLKDKWKNIVAKVGLK